MREQSRPYPHKSFAILPLSHQTVARLLRWLPGVPGEQWSRSGVLTGSVRGIRVEVERRDGFARGEMAGDCDGLLKRGILRYHGATKEKGPQQRVFFRKGIWC